MHIVIGLLTAIAALFWAINAMKQSGAWDSLNPFLWKRRRHWKTKYHSNPLYNITKPLESAGLLILGVARSEGELSSEHKQAVLELFKNEFHLDAEQASSMFVSSSHFLKDAFPLADKVGKILEHSSKEFDNNQKQSLLKLMEQIAEFESQPNEEQRKLIQAVSKYFKSN
ncbi:MAG: TerB family tellurite resistance protein [Methylococcales bacterium]